MTDTIKTERLMLRAFRDADGDAVVAALNDFEVSKWLAPIPHPFTYDDLRLRKEDGGSRWPELVAICRDGEVIGAVSGYPHFGYWISKKNWSRGYATEAGRAMLAWVFANTKADHTTSGFFEGNDVSARILQKFGFEEVGRGQHHCRARNQDLPHVNLRLSRSTWDALQ